MNFEEIRSSIESKLGEENVSAIADDMASLITLNNNQNETIKSYSDEINKLKKDKEVLISANGNLLKKIGAGKEEDLKPKNKDCEEKKPFNFRAAFDEKGNFKK